ncbi:antibiotic biosynthesis monooxygenase [Streptomyces sp. PmtG]
MTRRLDAPPVPHGDDEGLTFFSTWNVGTPERQRAAVEAIAHAWESRPWPHEGLLSYSVYEGVGGRTLMHHSRWRDERAYQEYFARGRDERNAEVDAAVPDVERVRLTKTRLYRSVTPGTDARVPGVYVRTEVDFEGPDADRQRDWADAVATALDDCPAPGLIGAHLHLSTDGTRVVTYAAWETEGDHEREVNAPAEGEAWRRVRAFPGVKESVVRRYRFAFGVSA